MEGNTGRTEKNWMVRNPGKQIFWLKDNATPCSITFNTCLETADVTSSECNILRTKMLPLRTTPRSKMATILGIIPRKGNFHGRHLVTANTRRITLGANVAYGAPQGD